MDPQVNGSDRGFFIFNAIVSVAALSLLGFLLIFHEGIQTDVDLRYVPAVNAALNGTAAALLTLGWLAIRKKKIAVHKRLMVGAFVCSTLFLVGYLAYHTVHGDTVYEGPARGVYLAILASHVLLSMPIVPMALSAFYFAWKKRFVAHKRVTRILAPVWLYVSVTGVVVYFFLHA